MSVQELLDKYANGTISASEADELRILAHTDPELQITLDELRKVDELFDFPKSERGKKVIGYIDSVEVAALAAMAGASVPIAASQSGWLYAAAGAVGAGVVASAIWLGTLSGNNSRDMAVPPSIEIRSKHEQIVEISPPAEAARPTTTSTTPPAAAPASAKATAPQKQAERIHRKTESVRIVAESAGENHNLREIDSLSHEIGRTSGNIASLADLHFKIAMLYKQERNYTDAKNQLAAARTEALKINLVEKAANALGEIGSIEKYNGNYMQAKDLINAAIGELRPIGSPEAERAIRRWENVLRSMR